MNVLALWPILRKFAVMKNPDYTIKLRDGRLHSLAEPQVMGILNVTPDSFFAASRKQSEEEIAARTRQIIEEGATIIDVGGCSTRPGGDVATEKEEAERLRHALPIVRKVAPDAIVSVDTFRPSIAKMTVEEFGADIINDVSEGKDREIFRTVARLGVPYILMSVASNLPEMTINFAREVQELRDLGQKDIILDPGFGFGNSLEDNYEILAEMEKLNVLELPLLVGISRKRMIHQLLGITANDSLNGTTVLNTLALTKGAAILRVHDVREAVQAVKIFKAFSTPATTLNH